MDVHFDYALSKYFLSMIIFESYTVEHRLSELHLTKHFN